MTFLGRPDKDWNALEAHLQDFVIKRTVDSEGPRGPTVALNPALISEEAKASLRKFGLNRPQPVWRSHASSASSTRVEGQQNQR